MAQVASHTVFDDLNLALTAQIEKLQSIDPSDKELMASCVKQSNAVADLAGNINRNIRNAIDCMRLQEQLYETSGENIIAVPKLLSGSEDA